MEPLFAQTIAENLLPARLQMALTLGFHIILACFGVGFPVLLLVAEWRFLKTGDELWRTLARRWSKVFAVLFAVGAVSGTVLSFELGLLWPEFMGRWGGVIGLPFTMEGFAFFLEAIFAGIYLYGWDRLPSRVHWWTGWPIAVSGFMSAFFVVTANSWMNTPAGFELAEGEIVNVDPIAAMFNSAAGAQIAHMIVAAYLVSGFGIAAFYALRLLRGSDLEYDRRGMTLGLLMALPMVPVQMAVGDWSAKVVAESQPTKLAAMEGQFETETRAPLRIGGIPDEAAQETRYAIEIPGGLSFLSFGNFDAEVKGLNEVPEENRPPVTVVHFAFQIMVGIGTLMLFAALWAGLNWYRHRAWPTSRYFLWLTVALGPLSILALEAGWVVTEVGRQPWIVQGVMRTEEAVTQAPGIWEVFAATLAIYGSIGLATVIVLRQIANVPLPKEEPHGAG
ncbi:MAG: cytochrome ubiquinol oxidase subunit I [Planctomycetaceae bacterium]|nr:cytochrome ubiquinol oxidase subunit I [Planctomycetaceae bacterium]